MHAIENTCCVMILGEIIATIVKVAHYTLKIVPHISRKLLDMIDSMMDKKFVSQRGKMCNSGFKKL